MKKIKLVRILLRAQLLLTVVVMPVFADYSEHPKAVEMINQLVTKHNFTVDEIKSILAKANTEQRILDSMANAAEKTKTWKQYRASFVKQHRVNQGVIFLDKHRLTFDRVEEKYGVPREIITAILGVETNYGNYTGNANVLDALATLAFEHPRRSKYFTSELKEYILLCREHAWQAEQQKGSYAGAMGMSQFMPSNYRSLAVDGNGDGMIDLFDPIDAIYSIANYFVRHGWQSGQAIASRASVSIGFDDSVMGKGLKPNRTIAELDVAGYHAQDKVDAATKARVIRFNDDDGDEFWLGYKNFYVISRYNPRSKYAMAVYHLSQAIAKKYQIKV